VDAQVQQVLLVRKVILAILATQGQLAVLARLDTRARLEIQVQRVAQARQETRGQLAIQERLVRLETQEQLAQKENQTLVLTLSYPNVKPNIVGMGVVSQSILHHYSVSMF
jgi:hypothetical protein